MKRLSVVEGQPIEVDPARAAAIRKRLAELQRELRPRFAFTGGDLYPVVMNLVGTVQISQDFVLDIEPKVQPGQDWARSLAALMTTERAEFGGEHDTAEWSSRTAIPEVLASVYARQLTQAVRREGPLSLIVNRSENQARLSGKLNTSRWVVSRIIAPHRFPQSTSVLSADNKFTAAMAWVASVLSKKTKDLAVRSLLQSAVKELRPGLPLHIQVERGVEFADIPVQWAAYGPAWSTAKSVLRQVSPIHRQGSLHGFGIAIEPWPLLETMLNRAVNSAAERGREKGMPFHASPTRRQQVFLQTRGERTIAPLSRIHTNRAVEPDAILYLGDRVAATFEAKYNIASQGSTRNHFFQALTTAAALNSPLSVLIYPEKSAPIIWDVEGFNGSPARVVAVGLDMFRYRRGTGDQERGAVLLDLILDNYQ